MSNQRQRAFIHATFLVGLLGVFTSTQAAEKKLGIEADVPEGTGTVYVAGSLAVLGDWKADGVPMLGTGTHRYLTVPVEAGTTAEFKITLGNWEHEALLPNGSAPPNTAVTVDEDTTVTIKVPSFGERKIEWKDTYDEAGVVGEIRRHLDFPSKYLTRTRHVIVRLPVEYASNDKRYGVLYMHDGENIFDPKMSFSGMDWGIDEALSRLSAEGKLDEMIVVGIFSTPDRSYEMGNFEGEEKYGRFLVEEVKPLIDKEYRTLPDRDHTGVMGASFGGRISLYLGWKHPEVFGKVACLSNAIAPWEEGKHDIVAAIEESKYPKNVKLYFDYGSVESEEYPEYNGRLAKDLESWGWKPGHDFLLHVEEGGTHTERSWRERLEIPLLFLFGKPGM